MEDSLRYLAIQRLLTSARHMAIMGEDKGKDFLLAVILNIVEFDGKKTNWRFKHKRDHNWYFLKKRPELFFMLSEYVNFMDHTGKPVEVSAEIGK